MKLPSGSKLSLAMKCIGSFLLPQVKSEPGEAALKGTRIHALVESYIKSGRQIPEGLEEQERTLLRNIGQFIGSSDGICDRPEIACLLCPGDHSARVLRVSRDEERPTYFELGIDDMQVQGTESASIVRNGPGGISGADGSDDSNGSLGVRVAVEPDQSKSFLAIADLVRIHEDGSGVEIIDWKTGSIGSAGNAQWNWQLILPAVVIWVIAGRPERFFATLRTVYLDGDAVHCKPDRDIYTAAGRDLERWEHSLSGLDRRAVSTTPGSEPLYEGKHCGFCPARDRCPAKIGALGRAVELSITSGDAGVRLPGLSHVDMMRAYHAIMESKFAANKNAYEILESHGGVLDLGDGRESVLTVANGRRKVFTRKRKLESNVENQGPDVAEDGKPTAASGGDPPAEGVRAGGEDSSD